MKHKKVEQNATKYTSNVLNVNLLIKNTCYDLTNHQHLSNFKWKCYLT